RVLQATVKVSEFPRVRFYAKSGAGVQGIAPAAPTVKGASTFLDVTHRVAKLIIEDLEQPAAGAGAAAGACDVLRLDAKGELIWRTHHQSMQEAKWHVEFEY